MHHTLPRLWTLLALLLVPAAAHAQPASPAELRREIDSLQAENVAQASEIHLLKIQLAAAESESAKRLEEVRLLSLELERLRQQLQTGTPPTTPDPTPSESTDPAALTHAAIPADPLASPASMLAELQRRYAADLAPSDANPTDPAAPLTVERRRQLDQWCLEQTGLLQGPVEWRVRFTDFSRPSRREATARMTVIDPTSGLPIGDPLEVAVPRTLADRLERELSLGRDPDKAPLWTLTANLSATPKLNPARPTPGVFNHPAFVGPYVEFAFDLTWRNVNILSESP